MQLLISWFASMRRPHPIDFQAEPPTERDWGTGGVHFGASSLAILTPAPSIPTVVNGTSGLYNSLPPSRGRSTSINRPESTKKTRLVWKSATRLQALLCVDQIICTPWLASVLLNRISVDMAVEKSRQATFVHLLRRVHNKPISSHPRYCIFKDDSKWIPTRKPDYLHGNKYFNRLPSWINCCFVMLNKGRKRDEELTKATESLEHTMFANKVMIRVTPRSSCRRSCLKNVLQ